MANTATTPVMAMTSVDALMQASQTNKIVTATAKKTLDQADFLNILVTQLKAQDPLNPMDSAQFTSQLTQFTSIESLNKINTTLTDIKSIQSSIDSAQAIGFVGKTIKANGNKIYLQESDTQNQADINFNLESSASNIAIGVYNASGDYVKTVYASGLSAGSNNVKWDKTDDSGKKVANGVYTFEITAVNQNNEKVNASPITSGKVTGLKFKDGLAYLLIGTQEVLSSDVIQVDDN